MASRKQFIFFLVKNLKLIAYYGIRYITFFVGVFCIQLFLFSKFNLVYVNQEHNDTNSLSVHINSVCEEIVVYPPSLDLYNVPIKLTKVNNTYKLKQQIYENSNTCGCIFNGSTYTFVINNNFYIRDVRTLRYSDDQMLNTRYNYIASYIDIMQLISNKNIFNFYKMPCIVKSTSHSTNLTTFSIAFCIGIYVMALFLFIAPFINEEKTGITVILYHARLNEITFLICQFILFSIYTMAVVFIAKATLLKSVNLFNLLSVAIGFQLAVMSEMFMYVKIFKKFSIYTISMIILLIIVSQMAFSHYTGISYLFPITIYIQNIDYMRMSMQKFGDGVCDQKYLQFLIAIAFITYSDLMRIMHSYRRTNKRNLQEASVVCDKICITIGKRNIIKDLSFTASASQITSIISPNGGGKTTVLQAIYGNVKLKSGQIIIKGERDLIQYCPQHPAYIPYLSNEENMRFFSRNGFYYNHLSAFSLSPRGYVQNLEDAHLLSLLIAISQKPSILLLDEISSTMRTETLTQIWNILKSMANTCIIMTTHSLKEAELLSDEIIILKEGKLLCNGNVEKLKEFYNCGYVVKIDDQPIPFSKLTNCRITNVNNYKYLRFNVNIQLSSIMIMLESMRIQIESIIKPDLEFVYYTALGYGYEYLLYNDTPVFIQPNLKEKCKNNTPSTGSILCAFIRKRIVLFKHYLLLYISLIIVFWCMYSVLFIIVPMYKTHNYGDDFVVDNGLLPENCVIYHTGSINISLPCKFEPISGLNELKQLQNRDFYNFFENTIAYISGKNVYISPNIKYAANYIINSNLEILTKYYTNVQVYDIFRYVTTFIVMCVMFTFYQHILDEKYQMFKVLENYPSLHYWVLNYTADVIIYCVIIFVLSIITLLKFSLSQLLALIAHGIVAIPYIYLLSFIDVQQTNVVIFYLIDVFLGENLTQPLTLNRLLKTATATRSFNLSLIFINFTIAFTLIMFIGLGIDYMDHIKIIFYYIKREIHKKRNIEEIELMKPNDDKVNDKYTLQMKNLQFNYQEINCNLKIGQLHGFISLDGYNDSSSLIKILGRNEIPKDGIIKLCNNNHASYKYFMNVHYIPNGKFFVRYMKLKFLLEYFRIINGAELFYLRYLIVKFGLDIYLNRYVFELSDGNLKKIVLVIGLMNSKTIVLFDSPMNSLDLITQNNFIQCLANNVNYHQRTYLLNINTFNRNFLFENIIIFNCNRYKIINTRGVHKLQANEYIIDIKLKDYSCIEKIRKMLTVKRYIPLNYKFVKIDLRMASLGKKIIEIYKELKEVEDIEDFSITQISINDVIMRI